jgi:hypothetical protein
MAEDVETSRVPLKCSQQPVSITRPRNPEDHDRYENLKSYEGKSIFEHVGEDK